MKPTFHRPEYRAFAAGCAQMPARCHAYPVALFDDYDVFDLLPLDGGAFFFSHPHLGGVSTRHFTEGLKSGRLFAPWTGNRRMPAAGDIDWFAAYDPERGPYAPGQKTEAHVWLHRLYFLLPFAQEYLRTGNTVWARRWMEYFTEWRRRFPAMGDPVSSKAKHSAFIWYDMQPTWRLLVLIHSVFMLGQRRSPAPFAPAEWGAIYKAVAVHARWVFEEAAAGLTRKATGNHFLQKGTALLYAGTLFPEMEGAAAWVQTGRRVIRDQLRREINRDGGSIEGSPSYSHFIARLYMEAYRVLAVNGRPPIQGLEASLRRQYAFLEATLSPSGRTLQIGDSYSLDAKADLAIVRRLFVLPAPREARSVCFPASRFVVLRSREAAVYVDAMAVDCGHVHTPKPNILVYARGRPVVVDCGCVNYDLEEYKTGHFRTWAAHNVVAPESLLQAPAQRRLVELELIRYRPAKDGGEVEVACRYTGDEAPFAWTRRVRLEGARVELNDQVTTPRRKAFGLWLHVARGARPRIHVTGPGKHCVVRETEQAAADEANRRVTVNTWMASQTGTRVEFRTILTV